MGKKDEVSPDLYVAAYGDASVAEEDWNALKQLADDDVFEIEALALVNRDADGKIHVKDTSEEMGKGATIGALGGALVGLIFPPSLLATAAIRTIFAQTDAQYVREQLETIAVMLGRRLPKVGQLMRRAREDLLGFTGFPQLHWRKIWSTNPQPRAAEP
jgi:Transposase, Mutator family